MEILNKLQLPNASSGHVTELDGWRGLAISLVMVSHFFDVKAFHLGSMGVNLFFALSGLLMANILFVKRVPLPVFYQRRLSRVFPVFFVFVTLIYLFGHLQGAKEPTNYLSTLFFLRSYIGDVGIWKTDLPVGHLWSLNVEEHAYMLLSVLTLCIRNQRIAGLALGLIGTLSIGIALYYNLHKDELINDAPSLLRRTEANLACLMIAGGYALNKVSLPKPARALPAISLFLGIMCYSDYAPWHAKTTLAPFCFAFTVVHLSEASEWFKWIFNRVSLRLVGLWSFSLYLWQQPFYTFVKSDGHPLLLSLMGILLSFFVAIISFYWLENPTRHFINSWYIKRRAF